MLPLVWYAIGTLACWAGWGLVLVGQAANRGHAACARLALSAMTAVDEAAVPESPDLPVGNPETFVPAQYGRTFTITREALISADHEAVMREVAARRKPPPPLPRPEQDPGRAMRIG